MENLNMEINTNESTRIKIENNLDASQLMLLLHLCGFSLKTCDVVNSLETELLDVTDSGSLKIDIRCTKSGMIAKMSKNLSRCTCPSKDDINKIKFQNISEPTTDKVMSSESSILPRISPENKCEISYLLEKIQNLLNKSTGTLEDIGTTPIKSKETIPQVTKPNVEKDLVKTSQAWEVDPNTSPPKVTSSPLIDFTSSLKQNSLNIENKNNLLELFVGIQKLVEKGKELMTTNTNTTFTKLAPVKKRVSNIKISPLALQPNPIAGDFIKMNLTHRQERSLRITPRKLIEPLQTGASTGDKRRMMKPPSRISMLYKKPTQKDDDGTPTNSKKNAVVRHDTPIPKVKINSNGLIATTLSPLRKFRYTRAGTAVTPSGENMPAGVMRLKVPTKLVTPNKKK